MISLAFALFRVARLVFLFFLSWAFLLIAINVMAGCTRQPKRDALNRNEINQRTFVRGTTEALRSFNPAPKKKISLPIQ